MEKKKPIKRHRALQPLSRQHHFGLLFSWKLRKGFSKNIDPERLQKYASWFFEKEIKPHFEAEEKYVFTVLKEDNKLIHRALKEHRRIENLFKENENPEKSLSQLEEELDAHIRFEERILFNEIQKVATASQLEKISEIHSENLSRPEYPDPFWEN
ncbi:MAG: cation-binding protein [Aequorivita sp.]|nr:MAG: cation-binding protein [Aequorivita sp.]